MAKNYIMKQVNSDRKAMIAALNQMRKEDFYFVLQLMGDLSEIIFDEIKGTVEETPVGFAKKLEEAFNEFGIIWNQDAMDLEYTFAKFDERLKPIYKDQFVPCKERYRDILRR